MCYYKPITVISILIFFSFYSCVGDADLTGFIRSTDRNEERLKLSLHSNSNNGFRRIVSLSDEYCILVASDAHLGEAKNLTHFLQQGEQQGIEALVLVGDIVSGKEKDYLLLTDVISSHSTKPLFLLTGNHELYFDGWKHFFRLFGSSVYYFSVASNNSEDLFICLDSGSGSIGKSQLQWLNNLLSDKRDKYRNCIIFTHNNFFRNRFTASTNPPENEIIVLMDLF